MKYFSGRVIFDIFLLLAAGVGLWQAQQLPETRGISQIDPGDFPTAVCVIGIVALLAVLFQDLRRPKHDGVSTLERRQIMAVTAVGLLLALYIATLSLLGFFIATVAFLFVATLACAYGLHEEGAPVRWRRVSVVAAGVSIIATTSAYLVFSYGFGLMFP